MPKCFFSGEEPRKASEKLPRGYMHSQPAAWGAWAVRHSAEQEEGAPRTPALHEHLLNRTEPHTPLTASSPPSVGLLEGSLCLRRVRRLEHGARAGAACGLWRGGPPLAWPAPPPGLSSSQGLVELGVWSQSRPLASEITWSVACKLLLWCLRSACSCACGAPGVAGGS